MEKVLAWSVANSAPQTEGDQQQRPTPRLDEDALRQLLMGGVDDAQLMVEAMQAITSSSVPLSDRETAFDNLEQLVENLDNANNLENLKLWEPLVGQLDSSESEMRFMAAWCIGTAVQNNEKSQVNVSYILRFTIYPLE
jgi:hsp70-interacting protein